MIAKKTAKGYGCGMLFLVPFGLVGVGIICVSYYMASEWMLMQNWVEVPATIESLRLKRSSDSDGTSYRVVAGYRYNWKGQEYTADRVGLHSGSDNIGSFQQRTYRNLKPFLNVPQGGKCHVNPSQPQRAILVRDPRWEMFTFYSIFASIFGSVGILGGLTMARARRDAVFVDSQRELHPDEPWTWLPGREGDRIRSEQHHQVRSWTRAAIWWTIATLPAATFSIMALLQGHGWALLGLVTPMVACYFTRTALRYRANLRQFGAGWLQLTECPLRAGLQTTLAVVFDGGELPHGPVESHVACVHTERRGDNTITSTIWEDSQQIELDDCRVLSERLCIAVPVTLPDEVRPSSTIDNSVVWNLTVTVPTRSRPMKVTFRLPVF